MISIWILLLVIFILYVVNYLFPAKYEVWRPFGKPINIHRCNTDGALVNWDLQESLRHHEGHYIKQPVKLSFLERILVWVRVIK